MNLSARGSLRVFPSSFRENSSGKSAQKQADLMAGLNPYDLFLRL